MSLNRYGKLRYDVTYITYYHVIHIHKHLTYISVHVCRYMCILCILCVYIYVNNIFQHIRCNALLHTLVQLCGLVHPVCRQCARWDAQPLRKCCCAKGDPQIFQKWLTMIITIINQILYNQILIIANNGEKYPWLSIVHSGQSWLAPIMVDSTIDKRLTASPFAAVLGPQRGCWIFRGRR